MRFLEDSEIEQALDDNGESKERARAIEATVTELAGMGVSMCCGTVGNKCFEALQSRGFAGRFGRGWYVDGYDGKEVLGMFHIQCSEDEGENIQEIAGEAGGSLRFSGKSLWPGFCEFEIE